MANPLKGELEIEVAPAKKGEDPRKLTLVYDWEALEALEDVLDMGILEVLSVMQRGLRLKMARCLFWAGLRSHHPEVTLREAGELVPRCGGIIALSEQIAVAVTRGFPGASGEAEHGAEGPQEAAVADAAAGTPNTASASGSSTD